MPSTARAFAFSVFAAAAAITLPALAAPTVTDSDVRFAAKGPAGLAIDGQAGAIVASESAGKLILGVSAQTLKTGMDLRDKHLRGYLNADKSPVITLGVERSKLNAPADGATSEGSATGDLTLNGVSKATTFKYKIEKSGDQYKVQGLFDVDVRNHKIEVPCYLGVCVDPIVKVKVKFKLKD